MHVTNKEAQRIVEDMIRLSWTIYVISKTPINWQKKILCTIIEVYINEGGNNIEHSIHEQIDK